MTDLSPHLSLPYLLPAQAQKHVTHNEAIRRLDLLVQLAVEDRDRTQPPAAPEEGSRHLVASGATGAWSGQDGRLAVWEDGQWTFLAPRAGWRAEVLAEGRALTHDGTGWQDGSAATLRAARLGLNADADAQNRLAVASPATLLSHEGAGHQLKVNKAAPGDTASLLFQTAFSGRAEMGLAGSDRFAVKVSADGASFAEALSADPATGRLSLPQGAESGAPLALPPGSAAAPALAFGADPDTGLFRAATDALGLAAGGAERARVTAAGLQVTGAITGTAVQSGATDATAGRVLTVGAFGLGTVFGAPVCSDLNAATTPAGLYRTTPAGTAGTFPPASGIVNGFLRVERFDGAILRQELQPVGDDRIFVRRCVSGAWQPWRLLFGQASAVGPVSQSGGLPSGALIETGASASGRYARWADGTQICTHTLTASATEGVAWTFPAAFAAAPVVTGTVAGVGSLVALVLDAAPTASAAVLSARNAANARAAATLHVQSVGRWF